MMHSVLLPSSESIFLKIVFISKEIRSDLPALPEKILRRLCPGTAKCPSMSPMDGEVRSVPAGK